MHIFCILIIANIAFAVTIVDKKDEEFKLSIAQISNQSNKLKSKNKPNNYSPALLIFQLTMKQIVKKLQKMESLLIDQKMKNKFKDNLLLSEIKYQKLGKIVNKNLLHSMYYNLKKSKEMFQVISDDADYFKIRDEHSPIFNEILQLFAQALIDLKIYIHIFYPTLKLNDISLDPEHDIFDIKPDHDYVMSQQKLYILVHHNTNMLKLIMMYVEDIIKMAN